MRKVSNFLIAILDGIFILGLIIKIIMGDGTFEDFVGIFILAVVAMSCVYSFISPKSNDSETE